MEPLRVSHSRVNSWFTSGSHVAICHICDSSSRVEVKQRLLPGLQGQLPRPAPPQVLHLGHYLRPGLCHPQTVSGGRRVQELQQRGAACLQSGGQPCHDQGRVDMLLPQTRMRWAMKGCEGSSEWSSPEATGSFVCW